MTSPALTGSGKGLAQPQCNRLGDCSITPTARLLASLLPTTWPDRAAALDAADRLDRRHDGDGSALLLRSWSRWRATGAVPDEPLLRDLLVVLGTLLGGIASEMRLRPRRHRRHSEVAC